MNIAIVDDHKEDREQLCSFINRYCDEHRITPQITFFASGDDLLSDYEPGRFQCIFLDIYMDGRDGMETAREIYRLDPVCRLVFATISTSHAVSSYEVRAAWYLTKPYNEARLTDAMDVVCTSTALQNRTLLVHIAGAEFPVRFSDIYFIDSENRQAKLHLQERIFGVDEPVSELLRQLSEDDRFLVCNRNTLVNMEHIDQAKEHDFQLENGDHVPIRQRGRAALKKTFLTWSLRELRQEGLI